MPREFRHRARQTQVSQRDPNVGEDHLLFRFDYLKLTGKLISTNELVIETKTVLGQHDEFVYFSHAKQYFSDARIKSRLIKFINEALSGMGVPEDLFDGIVDSVLVAIDKAESPMIPLDVGIWDITWVDEREPQSTLVPAATSFIQGLERVKLVELQDQFIQQTPSCAICLEDFAQQLMELQDQAVSVQVTRLACSHLYHLDCIVQCLQRSNLCPLCRHPMPTQHHAI